MRTRVQPLRKDQSFLTGNLALQEAGPSRRPRRAAAHNDGDQRGQSRGERTQRREAARRRAGPGTVPRLSASAISEGRPAKAYAWLQVRPHLSALVPLIPGVLSNAGPGIVCHFA